MNYQSSRSLFEQAQNSIPGGVNSPVRAFKSVGGTPVFIRRAEGAYLYDEDDNQYIDYIASWGPMILGHAYAPIVKAIREKVNDSTSFGAPTALEIKIAELVKAMTTNVELIRMVNSGTEATMSAIRLARGYTKRNKFIKFEGCYHGHADMFLVKAGSGVATFGIQQVPGVTKGVAEDTLTAPYNDLTAVEKLIQDYPNDIAAIIVEPVAGNMGCVLPAEGFLVGLREICTKNGIIFILDEVMTGFRLAPGGAQEFLEIDADLVCYGKVIGAGMPVGAFGGRKEIMSHIAPLGEVYQAGTLSGNPLAMIAGYTLLQELNGNRDHYISLAQKTSWLAGALKSVFDEFSVPVTINQAGSMMSIFFTPQPVTDFKSASTTDQDLFRKYFHGMLKRGVYLPPSAFESWFFNDALSQEDLEQTLLATRETLEEILD
ncbi:MAG TPA: glutamate-1-semialdehyde 2,1-aminomutase [Edaphocola sp.]|nr:glutamate-1-semialdehyde 2,1-aminomutase [Edaphocola sp.]